MTPRTSAMARLQNIEASIRVAQRQSFAEAARQLRVAKSVVTTRLKQLEKYVGAPLFHLSTRLVRLSESGQAYLRECTDLVSKASDLVDQMRDAKTGPAGSLLQTMHNTIAHIVMWRMNGETYESRERQCDAIKHAFVSTRAGVPGCCVWR